MNLLTKINGYKTYAVAVITIIYAIVYYGFNLHDYGTMCSLIFGMTGLGALRHGVAKVNSN